jgi:hypothetical protein
MRAAEVSPSARAFPVPPKRRDRLRTLVSRFDGRGTDRSFGRTKQSIATPIGRGSARRERIRLGVGLHYQTGRGESAVGAMVCTPSRTCSDMAAGAPRGHRPRTESHRRLGISPRRAARVRGAGRQPMIELRRSGPETALAFGALRFRRDPPRIEACRECPCAHANPTACLTARGAKGAPAMLWWRPTGR